MFEIPSETIKFLTIQEVEQFLKVIKSKRDLALIYVAYRHSLRVSEARLLQREDINFEAGQIGSPPRAWGIF